MRMEHANHRNLAPLRDTGSTPGWVKHVAGFDQVRAELIERPTPLPGGVADWVKTFRAGLMDVAMVPEWEREEIGAAVEARLKPALFRDGVWCADYVRLRFSMRKPG